MFRLFSRPGVLTSIVVVSSVASGVAFGVAVVATALVAREAVRMIGSKR